MAHVQVKRIAGGRDCGKLRVTVEVTLSEYQEGSVAYAVKAADATFENLALKPTERGVGPVGEAVARAMLGGADALVDKGFSKRKRQAKKDRQTQGAA